VLISDADGQFCEVFSSPSPEFGIHFGVMLKVYLHDGPASLTFVLQGELTRSSTDDLEHSWRTATSILRGRQLTVNLAGLTDVDDEGVRLLTSMSQSGASLITGSGSVDALARDISGRTPVVIPVPPMSFLRGIMCRFTRCCGRISSSVLLRRGCGATALKIW
jgi:ABC-type transporter Mla MlaB component